MHNFDAFETLNFKGFCETFLFVINHIIFLFCQSKQIFSVITFVGLIFPVNSAYLKTILKTRREMKKQYKLRFIKPKNCIFFIFQDLLIDYLVDYLWFVSN